MQFLEDLGVVAHKVASASVTDHELLRELAATGKPVILSTGMSTMDQIDAAVDILGVERLVLLHRLGRKMATFVASCVMLAWATPALTGTIVWKWIFDDTSGLVTWAFNALPDGLSQALFGRKPVRQAGQGIVAGHGGERLVGA